MSKQCLVVVLFFGVTGFFEDARAGLLVGNTVTVNSTVTSDQYKPSDYGPGWFAINGHSLNVAGQTTAEVDFSYVPPSHPGDYLPYHLWLNLGLNPGFSVDENTGIPTAGNTASFVLSDNLGNPLLSFSYTPDPNAGTFGEFMESIVFDLPAGDYKVNVASDSNTYYGNGGFRFALTPVPEPSSIALLLTAGVLLPVFVLIRNRRS